MVIVVLVIVGALRTEKAGKKTEETGNLRRIQTVQTTALLRSTRILWRFLESKISGSGKLIKKRNTNTNVCTNR